MKKILFSLLFSSLFAIYTDPELEPLWNSISDIQQPTIDDYLLIDDYLKNGERPYLDPLRISMLSPSLGGRKPDYQRRLNLVLNFNLLGPSQEMPLFEVHKLHPREETVSRCILIYASYNPPYPTRARRLLEELQKCGYSGHVLLRIGGFPNTVFGGLKICHLPYAFKVAFLKEAQNMGYTKALWIDCSLHPLDDLEKIFRYISEQGYFMMSSCSIKQSFVGAMDTGMRALSLDEDTCEQIPHIYSPILGLDLIRGGSFLDQWYREAENVWPYMTLFLEELSLSAIAWHHGMKPQYKPGEIICIDREIPFQISGRTNLQFYIDGAR